LHCYFFGIDITPKNNAIEIEEASEKIIIIKGKKKNNNISFL
jgi:hypothetical protein